MMKTIYLGKIHSFSESDIHDLQKIVEEIFDETRDMFRRIEIVRLQSELHRSLNHLGDGNVPEARRLYKKAGKEISFLIHHGSHAGLTEKYRRKIPMPIAIM